MLEKFKEILNERGIYGEDPEEILYAVSDLLEYAAEQTKEKEPYATNTIANLKKAAYEVWNLSQEE